MEKEVRAMLEKGEKVTLVAKTDSPILKKGEKFEIEKKGKIQYYLLSKKRALHFVVSNSELNELFELKQPKDPNEKKTKKERIEELEKRVEQLENKRNLEDAKSMVNDKNDLWEFFNKEHNLTLLDSEIEDIIHEVNKYQQQKQVPQFVDIDPEIGKVMNNFKPTYQAPEFLELEKTCKYCGAITNQPEELCYAKPPEFWYVDIVEEKDSELLPKFKEWFNDKSGQDYKFVSCFYGFSNLCINNGYECGSLIEHFDNSDKMQKITLNEWNMWFNK